MVRVVGAATTLDDLRRTPVPLPAGGTIPLGSVATIQTGALTRYGAVTADGAGETAQAIVIALKGADATRRARFIDALVLFGIGFSWGGFESLVVPVGQPQRNHCTPAQGYLIRVHAGLEHINDLQHDFHRALDIALNKPCVAIA